MKAVLLALGVTAALWLAVDRLGDLTQTRPEELEPGTRSRLVLDVDVQNWHRTTEAAFDALWSVCSVQVPNRPVSVAHRGAGRFEVVLSPALAQGGRKRLVGCLQDATVDRVRAHVRAVESS